MTSLSSLLRGTKVICVLLVPEISLMNIERRGGRCECRFTVLLYFALLLHYEAC